MRNARTGPLAVALALAACGASPPRPAVSGAQAPLLSGRGATFLVTKTRAGLRCWRWDLERGADGSVRRMRRTDDYHIEILLGLKVSTDSLTFEGSIVRSLGVAPPYSGLPELGAMDSKAYVGHVVEVTARVVKTTVGHLFFEERDCEDARAQPDAVFTYPPLASSVAAGSDDRRSWYGDFSSPEATELRRLFARGGVLYRRDPGRDDRCVPWTGRSTAKDAAEFSHDGKVVRIELLALNGPFTMRNLMGANVDGRPAVVLWDLDADRMQVDREYWYRDRVKCQSISASPQAP